MTAETITGKADIVPLADRVPPSGTTDGAEILGLIRDLHARLGATVLIVTHDLTVARSCPRTLTIRDGLVVGDERR